jgi:assimilatory nitrate reductase catalytic subunit
MTPTVSTRSTCPYCGVGCGVIIDSDGTRITGVRGDPEHPANFGRLCTKGSTLHLSTTASVTRQTRLLEPMRRTQRSEAPRAVSWDAALDELASRMADVTQRCGPDAIGLYVSGQLLTEDYYVFNKLAKGLLRTNNIDTNSRLCMSSAVAGYKATLGADAPPCSYEDIDHATTVFIAGSNLAWAHPVLMRRLEDAKRANPAQRWIVVDPRVTETARDADLHLRILPGTDVALFNGLAHLLLWEGLADLPFVQAHTRGFEALRDMVRNATPALTSQVCGIREDDLVQAARWFGGGPTLSLYCQGLNQSSSGTDKNVALINLHLLTGQIGKPGAGPFSLTGQPNAMGGREVGGLANLLSAHRDLAHAEHRAEVAALWGVDAVPSKPGKTAVEMFQAAADGAIELLWIVCTNPAQSMPDQAMVRRALERCPFVVVQEAYATTATAVCADLLLPATSWGEKDGTVTNSERRISRVRPAAPAPGLARDDWRIAVDVARRLEALLPPSARPITNPSIGDSPARALARDGRPTLFAYDSPESVWNEHRESTRGRDLDITGLSYAMLDTEGPQTWPLREGQTRGAQRLYTDGLFATPDGRAVLVAVQPRPLAETRNAHRPFSLTTGRLRDQWHGASRTGTIARLFGDAARPVVELHPTDLERLRVARGNLVRIESSRGHLVLPIEPSESVAPAQAFVAMHWGSEYLAGQGVNALTTGAYCPTSKQPELKHAAVKITKAALPWRLCASAWLPTDEAHVRRSAVMALIRDLPYAACVPFGRDGESTGLRLHIADTVALQDDVVRGIEVLLGLDTADVMRYADARAGRFRALRLTRTAPEAPSTLQALLLIGDIGDEGLAERLDAWLVDAVPIDDHRALMSGRFGTGSSTPRRVQVCNCFDVDEARIVATLEGSEGAAVQRLAALQNALHCGTQCGSCLPRLRELERTTPPGDPRASNRSHGPSPSTGAPTTRDLEQAA